MLDGQATFAARADTRMLSLTSASVLPRRHCSPLPGKARGRSPSPSKNRRQQQGRQDECMLKRGLRGWGTSLASEV